VAESEKSTTKKKRRAVRDVNSSTAQKRQSMAAPDKMKLLFTIVNREKAEFYIDLLHSFEVNMQMVLAASGTANRQMLELLGLADCEKSVIISVICEEQAVLALAALDKKFKTVKGGKGIAYTVPMSSIIGVAIYQFLGNKNGGIV